ncbi:toprim domain-containing protein [Fictibacillus sp. Mic-4]|uniref:toprim domain-containing protein n=1 Tax=Fictibacillus sp. Mic-4 TaxID=3132826 RepID=UPI003CF05B5A
MTVISVNGIDIDVDVQAELEQFEWTRAKWYPEKLLCASPFRYDHSPSFYVYLEDTPTAKAGNWGDSGAVDPDYAKGGFVKLLAFLREETTEETIEYLIEQYGVQTATDTPKLTVRLPIVERGRQALDAGILDKYRFRHPYLGERGIDERVQRLLGVGYSQEHGAVTIPWRLPDGRLANGLLANVKYRKTRGKAFWYEKGGVPIRELIYGIDVIYRRKPKVAVLTEAEIDAMTVMSCGFAAVATGGSKFNRKKADLLIRAPVEEIAIMTDNDEAGYRLQRSIVDYLRGYKRLSVVPFGVDRDGVYAKDANELRCGNGVEAVKAAVEGRVDLFSTQTCVLSVGRGS